MLVLTRRLSESLVIADTIKVTILDVQGDVVKLGIEAPREVTIHREEVYARIQSENVAASDPQIDKILELARLLKK